MTLTILRSQFIEESFEETENFEHNTALQLLFIIDKNYFKKIVVSSWTMKGRTAHKQDNHKQADLKK